ncbi:MAG: lysophospholipid acyltransferase family protein [Acidobacteria bacterium]|nr:lysophospholipid acyltransferase family protein [Acidobacteriota bacterium]
MKHLLDWPVYVLIRLFLFLIGRMPAILAYRFCEVLARLVFLLDRKHCSIGLINLSIAFPEQNESWRKKVLRDSFVQISHQLVELSRLPRTSAEQLRSKIDYEPGRGLENYLKARSYNKGVLFITGHVSAWELLPLAHASHGFPLSFTVRDLDNKWLNGWIKKLRSRDGNQALSKQNSMRAILRALKEGKDVGFLIDQNVQRKEGVFASFFGRPASTISAVALLARRTGTPVVPGFIYPDRTRGRYRIRFYPPLMVDAGNDEQTDVRQSTAQFNRYLEEIIREYPHCWLWGHRRFQDQPDGADIYHWTR